MTDSTEAIARRILAQGNMVQVGTELVEANPMSTCQLARDYLALREAAQVLVDAVERFEVVTFQATDPPSTIIEKVRNTGIWDANAVLRTALKEAG